MINMLFATAMQITPDTTWANLRYFATHVALLKVQVAGMSDCWSNKQTTFIWKIFVLILKIFEVLFSKNLLV